MRTLVVSDTHGNYTGLINLIAQFIDMGVSLDKDRIIFLGDNIDGFGQSKKVISHLRLLEDKFGKDRVVCLRGNHEQLLIDGWNKPIYDPRFRLWWEQGGRETGNSYGMYLTETSYRLDATSEFLDDVKWMKTLRHRFEDDHYHYVHAGFRPGLPAHAQDEFDMMWIRSEFIDSDYDFGKMVIFGHTPVENPIVHPTKIQIDTCHHGSGYITGAEVFADQQPKFYRSDTLLE